MQQSGSFQNKIDEESRELNNLLLYAKEGQWDNVWPIIGTPEHPKRAYLINSIPENRRWGVLHQAVYCRDQNIVQKLLKFCACDSSLKTKECTSDIGPTSGMTAIELASAYGYPEVKKVLTNHICNFETEAEEIDTFYPCHAEMKLKGFGLIHITLAAYKNTFHPKNIDPIKPIVTVLGDIFNDLNTSQNRWKDVRDKICDSLYVVSDVSAKQLKKCASRQQLYETIVNVYTDESTFLYTIMNTALRRQNVSDYKPSAIDLAMGPYVVMYQTLLLWWTELKRENATTYRRMLLTKKDVDQYQIGVRFTWLSFVSSSVVLEKAMPFPTRSKVKGGCIVIFTIDNTINSTHTPRNIETYAQYMERERVYPTGSRFVVTGRHLERNGEMNVNLKLLGS